MTGLLLACFVLIFTKCQCFLVVYKKICLKEDEVWGQFFSNKITVCDKRDRAITCVLKERFGGKIFQSKLLTRLSHKVCCLLSSPVLLRKFTYRQRIKIAGVLSAGINISVMYKKRVLFMLQSCNITRDTKTTGSHTVWRVCRLLRTFFRQQNWNLIKIVSYLVSPSSLKFRLCTAAQSPSPLRKGGGGSK